MAAVTPRDPIDAGPYFNRLPVEVTLEIFGYLDPQSLGRAAQVCQFFRFFASENALWKRQCSAGFLKVILGNRDINKIYLKEELLTIWRAYTRFALSIFYVADRKKNLPELKKICDKICDEVVVRASTDTTTNALDKFIQPHSSRIILEYLFDLIPTLSLSHHSEMQPNKLSTLDNALNSGCSFEVIEFLLDRGATPTPHGPNRRSTLDRAIENQYPIENQYSKKVIEFLLDKGAILTPFGPNQPSTLDWAITKYLSKDVIELLLGRVVTLTPHGPHQPSTLDTAIAKRYPKNVIELLLRKGADFTPSGPYQPSTLDTAIENQYPKDVIEFLFGIQGTLTLSGPNQLSSVDRAIKGNSPKEVLEFLSEKEVAILQRKEFINSLFSIIYVATVCAALGTKSTESLLRDLSILAIKITSVASILFGNTSYGRLGTEWDSESLNNSIRAKVISLLALGILASFLTVPKLTFSSKGALKLFRHVLDFTLFSSLLGVGLKSSVFLSAQVSKLPPSLGRSFFGTTVEVAAGLWGAIHYWDVLESMRGRPVRIVAISWIGLGIAGRLAVLPLFK